MNVAVISVGKLREKPYREMADEYLKRLSRYGKYEEIELQDLPERDGGSPTAEDHVKTREGEEILRRLRPDDRVIALTIAGIDQHGSLIALQEVDVLGAAHEIDDPGIFA